METKTYELIGNEREYILNKINTYYKDKGEDIEVKEYYSIDAFSKGKDKGKLLVNSYLIDNKRNKTYDIFDIKFKKVTMDEVDNSKKLYVNEDSMKYDNSMKVNVLDKFNKRISLSYNNLNYVRMEKSVLNTNYYFGEEEDILSTKRKVMEDMVININYDSVRKFTDYLYLNGVTILEVDSKWAKTTKGIKNKFKEVLR